MLFRVLSTVLVHWSVLQQMTVGMRILGQIVAVQPLALIVSLPDQLFAHVPITQISSQYTALLETMEEAEESEKDDDEGSVNAPRAPSLLEMFKPGQYIRAVVTAVHMSGTTDVSAIGKTRDNVTKASRRVELSLIPGAVNTGIHKADLLAGMVRGIFNPLLVLTYDIGH
jgi:rRNA biogenesis protein RRP5